MGAGNASGGGGNASGAIRAGRAFVELFLDDNAVWRSLAKLKTAFGKLSSLLKIGGGIGLGVGGALLAPITALLSGGVERAGKIGDLAEIFGGTTESVSKMAYAFEVAGYNLDEMEGSLSKLAKLNTTGRPLDEVFVQAVNALNDMPPGLEKSQAAAELFGKSYSKILDVGQDLNRLMNEAPIVSKEDAARAEELSQSFQRMKVSLQTALLPLLETLTPIVSGFSQMVRENAGLVRTVALIAAGLAAAGAAALILGFALQGALAVGSALAAIIGAVATPAGALVAVIGGLGYLLATETETGAGIAREIGDGFREAADTAKTSIEGIGDALRTGDFALAWEIALTGMELEWAKVVAFWTDGWNKFKDVFVDGWEIAATAVAMVLNDMAAEAESIFENVSTSIGNAFRYIADIVLESAERVATALDSIDPTDSFKAAIQTIHDLRATVSKDVRDAVRAQSEERLKGIEMERAATERALLEAHAAEQKARDEAREADLQAAKDDIATLEAKLQELRQRAAQGVSPIPGLITGAAGAIAGGLFPGLTPAAVAGASKGAFAVPSGRQQFGYGDTWQKNVLGTLLKTQSATEATAEAAKGIAQGLKFK